MKRTLIIVTIVLLIIILSLLLVRNEHLDRFNPLLKEKVSYAKVPKDTQDYRNIGSVAKLKLYAHLYKTIKANIVLTVKSFVSINYFSFFSINIT
ncbi:TPA: hypothetical protein ACYHFD_002781 [Staphylococcus aureus]